ncbi:MAG TPA: hypothetical protein VFJ97_02445 [Dermatophilaceae bacterium]|nr:hypothetical protein [Dermatophilaceae bacterium]
MGERSTSLAGHLHGAFSESTGSAAAHYSEASRLGIDAVAITDHDWRLANRCYRRAFHFSAMSERGPDGVWQLVPTRDPGLTSASGASIVGTDVCPGDTTAGAGSLRLTAASTSTAVATLAVTLDASGATNNYSGHAGGRTLHLWVKPIHSVAGSYLSLRCLYSTDPVHGTKQVIYQFRTDVTAPTVLRGNGTIVNVLLPVSAGAWNEVIIVPAADVEALWPDQVSGDSSFKRITFQATSKNTVSADGLFGGFSWAFRPGWAFETGYVPGAGNYDPLADYIDIVRRVAAKHPGILSLYGLEHSVDQHFCQIGGTPFLYPYADRSGDPHPVLSDAVGLDQVAAIRQRGGIVTANHPFGTIATLPTAGNRASLLSSTKKRYLQLGFWDADVLETGYDKRGMDLRGHQSLFDCGVSNGHFITANGVSDDHVGSDWSKQVNRFLTHLWTRSQTEAGIQAALRNGRATVGRLGDWRGALDLNLNGRARMGQVLVDPAAGTDRLVVEASGLPAGSSVHVLRGVVDYSGAGAADPVPVATLAASAFAGGAATANLPYSRQANYYRVDVLASDGRTIAFSNPVWHLPAAPAPGRPQIPRGRLAV